MTEEMSFMCRLIIVRDSAFRMGVNIIKMMQSDMTFQHVWNLQSKQNEMP